MIQPEGSRSIVYDLIKVSMKEKHIALNNNYKKNLFKNQCEN